MGASGGSSSSPERALESEDGEAEKPIFRLLVVAPLRADAEHATSDPWPAPVRFERATFDDSMAAVAPSFVIDVPDPRSPTKKPARLELTFSAMRHFRPDALVAGVPFLQSLATSEPASTASTGGSLVDDILAEMDEASPSGAPADEALESVLLHPVVRSLERAWRGLHFLVSRADSRAIVVEAIAAEADEVEAVLERVARRTAVVDLIVVDHVIGKTRRELSRLESWSRLAEGIGAPLVANGSPELVGVDDLASLGRAQRRLRSSDDPRAVAARAVAARDETRWVALALNGALARARHEGSVPRAPGFSLDEPEPLFFGPAHMVASLVAASFARTGWPCSLTGATHGALRDLPVCITTGVATPVEAQVSEEAAEEASAAGLVVFQSLLNSDVAILAHAPVLYRAPSSSGGAAAAATHGLADQLFVARMARVVSELASAIPAETPEPAARDVVRLTLTELFADAPRQPEFHVTFVGVPRCLEVTLKPRGFYGVRLEEVTLGAPLN